MANDAAVQEALHELAGRLVIPVDLIEVHRRQPSLGRTREFQSIRYGAFLLAYASFERYFNHLVELHGGPSRGLPATMDKIREAIATHLAVINATGQWRARVRVAPTRDSRDRRAKWTYLESQRLRDYLRDAQQLRHRLAHGAEPTGTTNHSQTLFALAKGGVSANLMWVEGFVQAVQDLASITAITISGPGVELPGWPEPTRSGVSAAMLPPPY
ncbi:hypothetical protein ABT297_41865 [Dactylosporangium sp. NPDC000555]|uniref:hypothetical protein n=1 Tax=Dactylosporangium sp. NPDC000555 TaxID=3154260 RepID=UPI003329F42D